MNNQDQSTEQQLFYWQFQELIKTLIIFSLPAKEQIRATGYGCVGDDLVEDFNSYYCLVKHIYLEKEIINLAQYYELELFDVFLNKFSTAKNYDFWCNPTRIETDENWEIIRVKAKRILVILNKEHLGLQVHQTNHPDSADTNHWVQITKSELTDKNAPR